MTSEDRQDQIPEIQVVGVFDRGVPNKERIAFRVTENVELLQFAVVLLSESQLHGTYNYPANDHIFFFGDCSAAAGTWVFLYTSAGRFTVTKVGTSEPAMVFFWGKSKTILHQASISPVLIKLEAAKICQSPQLLTDESGKE